MRRPETEDEIYEFILEHGSVSEDALQLVVTINGYNADTLNDVIYAVEGYRSIDDWIESEYHDEYEDDDKEDEDDSW